MTVGDLNVDGYLLRSIDGRRNNSRAAKRAGTSAHSFILEAIAEKADQEERRAEFLDTAERRYAGIVATGKTVPWSEMRRHLERRLAGGKTARPKAKEAVKPKTASKAASGAKATPRAKTTSKAKVAKGT